MSHAEPTLYRGLSGRKRAFLDQLVVWHVLPPTAVDKILYLLFPSSSSGGVSFVECLSGYRQSSWNCPYFNFCVCFLFAILPKR